MTLSEWLETMNPCGIMNQELTARDFYTRTGHKPGWPTHTVAECRSKSINSKTREQPDDLRVAYAWEIAHTLCFRYTQTTALSDVSVESHGEKARIWKRAIEQLSRHGL